MISPPSLKTGDKVCVLSTARKMALEEVQSAIDHLEAWGLEVQLSPYLFEVQDQFAGDASTRAKAMQQALDDLDCKAIVCARGGYGTVQIIDQLDFTTFKQSPKWIVGYSDVTVLHNHLQQVLGVESMHATMPINFPKQGISNNALDSLKQCLFEDSIEYSIPAHAINTQMEFEVEGHVLGGNLSILYSLTGTVDQLNGKDAILFLEDLDEYLYHIDRMMMNLKRAGVFHQCKAVVIGGMSDMNDNAIPFGETAEEIIKRNLADLGIPIIFGFPAGHIEDNRALIMGRKMSIKGSSEQLKLRFHGRA